VVEVKFLLHLLVIKYGYRATNLVLIVFISLLNHDFVDLLELWMGFEEVFVMNLHGFSEAKFANELLPDLRPRVLKFFHSLVVLLLV
jgi:hypothetical protein